MSLTFEESAKRFEEVLDRHGTFLLTGHVNIDGDSLGSMLAMLTFLRRRGKDARAVCFEPIHERYAFLGGDELVEIFDADRHAEVARSVDVFMMFDFSATSRMPGLWPLVEQGSAYRVCIDHHPTESLPGHLNIHFPTVPATGKIVLDLIDHLGGEVDREMAQALLVAISTDTGWFRYSNTNAAVLGDAARLVGTGLDANAVYREIYQRNDTCLIRLMGRVAAEVNDEAGGRLLWATIPIGLVHELGVPAFETDELLDLLRTGRDAEVVALFRELDSGEVRVNLRSRGKVDVSEIARFAGGGGHRHAAGSTMEGPLAEAAESVLGHARSAVDAAFASTDGSRSRATRSGR